MEKITQIVQVEVGDILKRLLEIKGITTSELLKKSGMSRNYITILKKGRWVPTVGQRLSTVKILATILDVPPQLFIKAQYKIEKEELK